MWIYAAILEDDVRRVSVMRQFVRHVLPHVTPVFFDRSLDMIDWLRINQEHVVLISLDHDLPFLRRPDQTLDDFGTGREVADYLAALAPTCPVLIHTSNAFAGDGMMRILNEAAWIVSRVMPHDDLSWIQDDWTDAIRTLMHRGLVVA